MSAYRDQLFLDIFTTALEGGIGYWSTCSVYHWLKPPPILDDDLEGFYAIVFDDEEPAYHRIDRHTIAKGYRLATTEWRDKLNWSTGSPPLIPNDDNDWDFDAGDADLIVQLGLFSDVIYG